MFIIEQQLCRIFALWQEMLHSTYTLSSFGVQKNCAQGLILFFYFLFLNIVFENMPIMTMDIIATACHIA